MNIGSVIMKKRKSLGYTQQNLADKLHVSFQAVSKWENGTACPEIDLLPGIATVLGTSVDTLLGIGRRLTYRTKGWKRESCLRKSAEHMWFFDFFNADIMDFRLVDSYDIILSSGNFHFIKPEVRNELIMKEELFDCNSGGIPHQHCMDTMIVEKGYKGKEG